MHDARWPYNDTEVVANSLIQLSLKATANAWIENLTPNIMAKSMNAQIVWNKACQALCISGSAGVWSNIAKQQENDVRDVDFPFHNVLYQEFYLCFVRALGSPGTSAGEFQEVRFLQPGQCHSPSEAQCHSPSEAQPPAAASPLDLRHKSHFLLSLK